MHNSKPILTQDMKDKLNFGYYHMFGIASALILLISTISSNKYTSVILTNFEVGMIFMPFYFIFLCILSEVYGF